MPKKHQLTPLMVIIDILLIVYLYDVKPPYNNRVALFFNGFALLKKAGAEDPRTRVCNNNVGKSNERGIRSPNLKLDFEKSSLRLHESTLPNRDSYNLFSSLYY